MSDDPPILPVGTAVSAKYKGAFCEAKVSRVFPQLRYRVSFKEPHSGTETLKEEHIKATGPIRTGRTVLAWHPAQKTFLEAQVTKIQDQSQYTVVFDDGDITTLRRNYLCLKSGRHFNESETLDQLPLTHPEHFSNPVIGGRSRRRNRNREDDSEGEHEEADPEMEGYHSEVGRVVWGENLEKKRNKDWPPGLIMLPKNTKILNTKEEFLIRSFKDDRFYNVPKKDVIEFNKEEAEKIEKNNTPFSIGVQKALKYLNTGELPANWEKHFHSDRLETDAELNFSDSSDDEPCEEKDRFVAQLFKFLDEAGTPLNKTPVIAGEDVDLYRLFSVVFKLGGYNKVNNHNKWKTVTGKLKYGNGQSVVNQIKAVYKKCLLSFEAFYKTLGLNMMNHMKSSRKNKGRSLIRDKDRATPINSPKPEKEEEAAPEQKKEDEKSAEEKPKTRVSEVKEDNKKSNVKEVQDGSDSSSDNVDQNEPSTSSGRPKRYTKVKSWAKDKKTTKAPASAEKAKPPVVEKQEEPVKKEVEKDKGQQTRSKTQQPKASTPTLEKKIEVKTPTKEIKEKDANAKDPKDKQPTPKAPPKKIEVEDRDKTKRPRKRSLADSETEVPELWNINKGDKLKVYYYGPTVDSKVTYEAKVLDVIRDGPAAEPAIRVHYTGWNNRYDEWIKMARVAENLSATTKAKKIQQKQSGNSSAVVGSGTSSPVAGRSPTVGSNSKPPLKKKRGGSDGRRPSATNETTPRSTTPLSSTSNSSRPKTPATPATRSTTRSFRQEQKRIRRTSTQTDTSVHTDTESPVSESETEELTRTRSGGAKSEETEVKVYKKKVPRTPPIQEKLWTKPRDEDDDTEKEEEPAVAKERILKKTRKVKRTPEKSNDESDDEVGSCPKGRDFDLNQIRSELKGFTKVAPLNASIDSADKDTSSEDDDDDSTKPMDIDIHVTAEEDEDLKKTPVKKQQHKEEHEEKDIPKLEETSSCEDIYEFKEPEPFEFESRSSLTGDDKCKKRLQRFFEESSEKSSSSPSKMAADKASPSKMPKLELGPHESDKKSFRSPIKTVDFGDDEEDEDVDVVEEDVKPKKETVDLFDKLVESPCFNIVKTTEKPVIEEVPKEEPEESVELFREPPEIVDDCSGDMELSDTESQTQPIFTVQSEEVFSDAFTKSSSEQNTLDLEFSKSEDRNVDEEIQASIQRVIEQTSTDDDTQDALLQVKLPVTSYQAIKHQDPSPKSVIVGEQSSDKPGVVVEKSPFSILSQLPPVVHHVDKDTLVVADIENVQVVDVVCPSSPSVEVKVVDDDVVEIKQCDDGVALDKVQEEFKDDIEVVIFEEKNKEDVNIEVVVEEKIEVDEVEEEIAETCSIEPEHLVVIEPDQEETFEIKVDCDELVSEVPNLIVVPSPKEESTETKKRRKVISRPYIESDSDSSDSDNLVIARSDDESQSNSTLDKEIKDNWDSNMSTVEVPTVVTDDSQMEEDQRKFKFEETVETEEKPEKKNEETEIRGVSDNVDAEEQQKEEQEDSQLHSMLLCEETIPRSPAPLTEINVEEPVRRSKSALEMPFASVPGSSNSNKSMLLNPNPVKLLQSPPMIIQNETENVGNTSPLSSAESTLSNLSPRGNNGGMSPYSQSNDNANIRSEFQEKRDNSNKVSQYSDEDSQLVGESSQKNVVKDEEPSTSTGRTSRRSYQASDHSAASTKRRKSGKRTAQNSESDEENSYHSPPRKVKRKKEKRPERPLRYDFNVNLDGITDRNERIRLVMNALQGCRSTYNDVRTELTDIERRLKKIRRKKREGLKSKRKERRDRRDSSPV